MRGEGTGTADSHLPDVLPFPLRFLTFLLEYLPSGANEKKLECEIEILTEEKRAGLQCSDRSKKKDIQSPGLARRIRTSRT